MKLSKDYIGGFFDGEGSIFIKRERVRNRAKSIRWSLEVKLGNTEEIPVRTLHEMYGGSLRFIPSKTDKHKDFWMWTVSTAEAEKFLRSILSHLIIKRERAEVALAFRKEFSSPRTQLTQEMESRRESFWEKMRRLNFRGKNGIILAAGS